MPVARRCVDVCHVSICMHICQHSEFIWGWIRSYHTGMTINPNQPRSVWSTQTNLGLYDLIEVWNFTEIMERCSLDQSLRMLELALNHVGDPYSLPGMYLVNYGIHEKLKISVWSKFCDFTWGNQHLQFYPDWSLGFRPYDTPHSLDNSMNPRMPSCAQDWEVYVIY